MVAVKTLNPKTKVAQAQAVLVVNITVGQGLQDVLRINLGPKGTMKTLVSCAGDINSLKMEMCRFMKCKCNTQQPP